MKKLSTRNNVVNYGDSVLMIMETLYSQLFPNVKEKKDTKQELDDLVLNRRLAKAKNKERLE